MTPLHAAPIDIESVASLLPAFEFEGLIAQGQSSSIFKARHRSLDRDVAIKIMPSGTSVDQSSKTGARIVAGLNHPNLIRVFDCGEQGDLSYVVMEYVAGKPLDQCARGMAIEPTQASKIIIAICKGLAHAHDNGVIHGEITASDILLNQKREPKIGNFGNSPCTEGNTAPHTDVFALGLILRELLTGVPRDSSNAASTLVPDMKLAMICNKATHPNPERRYPDASALGEALSRAIMPADNTPPVQKQPTSRLQGSKPALAVSVGYTGSGLLGRCAVIAFLLFSICGVWGFSQAKQERISRLQNEEDAKPKVFIVQAAETDGTKNTALVRWER